jgi:hypothetical protein
MSGRFHKWKSHGHLAQLSQCSAGVDRNSSRGMPWPPIRSLRLTWKCRQKASVPVLLLTASILDSLLKALSNSTQHTE